MMEVSDGVEALADFVRTTVVAGVSRNALLLRTERLPNTLSVPERMRHARAALEPLAAAERVRWHDLPGGRMVVSWKGEQTHSIEHVIGNLTRVLQDAALDAPPISDLIDLYALPQAGEALIEAAAYGLPVESSKPAPVLRNVSERVAPALLPLEPAELDQLEHSLSGTDLSRFARRRPVSTYYGRTAQLAWEERTLSIPELIETVAPGRDARSDVWLFRRLTRVLDRRMLSILSDAGELRSAGPFSITLNVASVLSPEFLRFDAALPAGLRSRVVISFLPPDLASDTGAFAFARNFVWARSYRVCLRAVSAALLPALDLPALDLDFVQLIWSAELSELTSLPDPGRARWIVGQPFTAAAAAWGVKQGINLFTMKPTE